MRKIIHEIIDVAELLSDPRVIPGAELAFIRKKAEKYDQMKEILLAFFLEKANPSDLTDYMECYETLGKLKDFTVDTSEKRLTEKTL